MAYCSIHNHTAIASNVRFSDSINRVDDMVDRAIEYGFSGLAFTDHEALCAHIDALHARDRIKKEHPEFKIIFGNEIYLIHENEYKNAEKYFHFILLAKDREGYQQLRELSTSAWERSYVERGQRRCPTFYEDFDRIVGENKGHLIASTACLGGALATKILQHDRETVNWFLNWGISTFGKDDFYLEIQDSDSEEQKIVNDVVIKLAKCGGLKFIVTQDTHYLDKSDYSIFEKFLNGKESKEREVFSFYQYTYMKPESEIKQILSYLPEEDVQRSIDNTQSIYDSIEDFDFRMPTIIPECHIPEFKIENILGQWYDRCPNIKFYALESEFPQDRYLMYLIEQGIKEKDFKIGEVEIDRIETELDVYRYISDRLGQRMSAYSNLVKTLVDIMWQVSIVGVSRGSAMCFLIHYLIGITQANPLDYNVPYWRYLNKERVELGDIDVDSDPTKTDQIIALFREYFGQDRVLNCLTYKKESLKSAIITCCRGLGISVEDSHVLSAMVPIVRGQSYTLADCENGNEEKDYEPFPQLITEMKKYPGLYEAVQKIEGLPNGCGCHASALYIFNTRFTDQVSMMRTSSGIPVTCFDYHGSDECGCLKVDELRTDAMTRMMKTMELLLKYKQIEWQGSLRATYNKYLHPDVLDYTNSKMWDDMAQGRISNLFQMATPQGAVCIKKVKPHTVKELSSVNSIMRLVGQEGQEMPIDKYVRFKNDISQWYKEMSDYGLTSEEQRVLKEELGASYGISGEQEDMMRLVQRSEVSGFTLGEANKLRKGIAKKQRKLINELREKFFSVADDGEEDSGN